MPSRSRSNDRQAAWNQLGTPISPGRDFIAPFIAPLTSRSRARSMHRFGMRFAALLLAPLSAVGHVDLMWPPSRFQNPTGVAGATASVFPTLLEAAGGCHNFACLWFNQASEGGGWSARNRPIAPHCIKVPATAEQPIAFFYPAPPSWLKKKRPIARRSPRAASRAAQHARTSRTCRSRPWRRRTTRAPSSAARWSRRRLTRRSERTAPTRRPATGRGATRGARRASRQFSPRAGSRVAARLPATGSPTR